MLKKSFTILSALLFSSLLLQEARAELITFDFTATVTLSQNTQHLTGGVVPVPSVITGSYSFDSNAVDQDPSTFRGFYVYQSTPYGFTVQAGSNTFQTDPNQVEFWIVAEDGNTRFIC